MLKVIKIWLRSCLQKLSRASVLISFMFCHRLMMNIGSNIIFRFLQKIAEIIVEEMFILMFKNLLVLHEISLLIRRPRPWIDCISWNVYFKWQFSVVFHAEFRLFVEDCMLKSRLVGFFIERLSVDVFYSWSFVYYLFTCKTLKGHFLFLSIILPVEALRITLEWDLL